MAGGWGVNVGVTQTLAPTAKTGQKYYGTSLAASTIPNPNAPNRNQNIYVAAIIGVTAAIAIFMYYRGK